MQEKNQEKNHLATLDGLRGVAAIAVMLMHFSRDWQSGVILPKAYLAVDFFFALSGFVIAKAYEDGLQNNLSFVKFSKLRLQRLYPLIFLSACIAVLDELPRIALHASAQSPHELLKLGTEFGFGILLLPNIFAINGKMFPLNGPSWSLFYEFGVNFFYAGISRYLTNGRLVVLLVVSGVCLVHLNYHHGSADFGYSLIQYKAGAARVVFSFFMGVMLYRLRQRGAFKNLPAVSGFWLAAALLLTFLPWAADIPWYYDLACIFLVYPLLIAAGSEDHLPAKGVALSLWLGRISYPVYLLHWPIIYRNSYHIFYHRHGFGLVLATTLAALAMMLFAWLALVFYDEPVRARLRQGFRRKPAKELVLAMQDAG